MANLVNAEQIEISFGTTTVLDEVSLGIAAGEVIGVVGRNGSGKTTLLRLLTGTEPPDAGRITRTGSVSIGYLHQADDFAPGTAVRDVIVGGRPDHVWAADPWTRGVVRHLLADVDLDGPVVQLSGGERRRVALVGLMLAGHDLLVLDEPTNHLDVEAVSWLADHLAGPDRARHGHTRGQPRPLVPGCGVHPDVGGPRRPGDAYDGGYAAYVLARAERARQAAGTAAPATQPPAQGAGLASPRPAGPHLQAEVPHRGGDRPDCRRAAASGLPGPAPVRPSPAGQGRVRPSEVTLAVGDRTLVHDLSWSIGPGDRIGIVGVNGTGKTSLLRALTGDLAPVGGLVKPGQTLVVGRPLPGGQRAARRTSACSTFVDRVRRVTRLAGGQEMTASALLEEFGFTGDRLTTRIGELSGGERRRLQLLRLLLDEPNVLLLDEPTNDLDIDTLNVVEDYLDSWPGTLIVVSHDRYFLERVCDVTYALLGDGSLRPAPRRRRRVSRATGGDRAGRTGKRPVSAGPAQNTVTRQARKDLNRIESQLARLAIRDRPAARGDGRRRAGPRPAAGVAGRPRRAEARQSELEESWLTAAEHL